MCGDLKKRAGLGLLQSPISLRPAHSPQSSCSVSLSMESSLSAESSSSGIIRELRGIRGGGGKTERILAIDMFYGHASPSSSAALLIWHVRKVLKFTRFSSSQGLSSSQRLSSSQGLSSSQVFLVCKAVHVRKVFRSSALPHSQASWHQTATASREQPARLQAMSKGLPVEGPPKRGRPLHRLPISTSRRHHRQLPGSLPQPGPPTNPHQL